MTISYITPRLLGLLLIAAIAVAFAGIGTAFASIDPIVSSECAAQASNTTAGDGQHPPGQTPGATPGSKGALKAIFNSADAADNGTIAFEHCPNV